MSEIRFYHMLTQGLDQVLPAILSKAMATGRRIVVRFADSKEAQYYDDHLWTYHPDSFLPHGMAGENHDHLQPICLTSKAENPNEADMLVLCNHHDVPENIAEFSLCCDFLDGRSDDQVEAGRVRWKAYKEAGHEVTYWQQTETGGWEQKA